MNRGLAIALWAGGVTAVVGGVAYAIARKQTPQLTMEKLLALASLPNVAFASDENLASIQGMLARVNEATLPVTSIRQMWSAEAAAQAAAEAADIAKGKILKQMIMQGGRLLKEDPFIVVNSDAYRVLYTHGLYAALEGYDGSFSLGALANHADCQTAAAQMTNLYNNFLWPFYNQNVYRYPSSNPAYAGVPIVPSEDPGAFEQAAQDAIEANIQAALDASALIDPKTLERTNLHVIFFPADPFGKPDPSTRDDLAAFAAYMAKQQHQFLDDTDANGNELPEPLLTTVHASIGAASVVGLIGMLDPQNPNNPCVRQLDAGLVLEMFTATIGTVLTLAIGPALSGIATVVKIITTIQKLSSLAQ